MRTGIRVLDALVTAAASVGVDERIYRGGRGKGRLSRIRGMKGLSSTRRLGA